MAFYLPRLYVIVLSTKSLCGARSFQDTPICANPEFCPDPPVTSKVPYPPRTIQLFVYRMTIPCLPAIHSAVCGHSTRCLGVESVFMLDRIRQAHELRRPRGRGVGLVDICTVWYVAMRNARPCFASVCFVAVSCRYLCD